MLKYTQSCLFIDNKVIEIVIEYREHGLSPLYSTLPLKLVHINCMYQACYKYNQL